MNSTTKSCSTYLSQKRPHLRHTVSLMLCPLDLSPAAEYCVHSVLTGCRHSMQMGIMPVLWAMLQASSFHCGVGRCFGVSIWLWREAEVGCDERVEMTFRWHFSSGVVLSAAPRYLVASAASTNSCHSHFNV